MSSLLHGILGLPPLLVLALVFLLPALEASAFIGVIVPGEISVILGGVLANQHRLPLAAVLIAAISGAVVGDSVGYWVGGRHGEFLLQKIPNRILKPQHVDRAKRLVHHYGGRAVFAGRWTAALRALMPGMAGLARIRYRKFLIWNVIGGLSWAVVFVLVGFLAGSQYQRFERYANELGLAALLVIIAFLIIRYLHDRRSQGASRP